MPPPESGERLASLLAAARDATSIGNAPAAGAGATNELGESVFVPNHVERATYHDFATYEPVFDPWAVRDPANKTPEDDPAPVTPPREITPPPTSYLPADLADITDLTALSEAAIAYFLTEIRDALPDDVPFNPEPIIALIQRFRFEAGQVLLPNYDPQQVPARAEMLLLYFIENLLPDLLVPFEGMKPPQRTEFYSRYFGQTVRDWVLRARDMEMPWHVLDHEKREWDAGGYRVLDIYGSVPLTTNKRYVGAAGDGVFVLTWVQEGAPPREVKAHEYALKHVRRHSYSADTGNLGAYQNPAPLYGDDPLSYLLDGAQAILDAAPPYGTADAARLAAEVQAKLGPFAHVTGQAGAAFPQRASELYGFEPYPTNSINFGIRVVYRQAWHPRGIQPGELVRTIPLAPGQKERFSVKYIQRNKVTRELEEKSSTESTQESTTTTKDSSEIVEEAARSSKWHVDVSANGSFNIGIFSIGASTSTGYSSDSSETSRDTKSRLTETMQKTARTSRRETRAQVSTEREETFESEHSSEITNPNQEIAVTCLYETVQQIYTVRTALAGLDSVVFVAERVPRPDELTIDWLRRHDWILSRALLDESFRETLGLVSTQHPDFADALSAKSLGLDEVARLSFVLAQAETSLKEIHKLPGNIANTYEAALTAYQAAVARSRASIAEAQQLLLRLSRLIYHIADNILHYCRAIWAAEDPERRRMRYASLRVPTNFFPSGLNNVGTDPLTGQSIYTGAWVADPASWRSLSEVIHPTGPIAYAGNYAVYRLRYSALTAGISRVTRLAQQAYCDPVPLAVVIAPTNRAAALNVTAVVEHEDFYSGDTYILRVAQVPPPPPPPAPPSPAPGGGPLAGGGPVAVGLAELQLTLHCRSFDDTITDVSALLPRQGRVPAQQLLPVQLSFAGLHVTIAGGIAAGDRLTLLPRPSALVDPEIKYRRVLDPQAPLAQLQQQVADENTEDIVVDTNNLWLNLVKGTGTALEDFKLEHRRIDVEIARSELGRRYARLDQNILSDPDIEKKVIIQGPAHAARTAEGEAVLEDPPPAPAPAPAPAPVPPTPP